MKAFTLLYLILAAIGIQARQTNESPRKVIKDPREYSAYMAAISVSSPQAKAQALEAFVQDYPSSIVQEEALEQMMAAYQQAGDRAKLSGAAARLLKLNPNNLRALAVSVYETQLREKTSRDTQEIAQLRRDAADLAKRGLQAVPTFQKPAAMSDDDYVKFISGVTNLFNSALASVNAPDNGNSLETLMRSKNWTPTTVEIRQSYILNSLGDVQAMAVIAGQQELLLCTAATSTCATMQPGIYKAEVKKGEFRIFGKSMMNDKQAKASFHISGTW